MKKLLLTLPALALLLSSAGVPTAGIRFLETSHAFGTVGERGGRVSHTFRFVNSGTAPLIILRANVSCVCTKAEYKRRPVAPGDTAALVVSYNPRGRRGFFASQVSVYSNAPGGQDILVVTGEIKGGR